MKKTSIKIIPISIIMIGVFVVTSLNKPLREWLSYVFDVSVSNLLSIAIQLTICVTISICAGLRLGKKIRKVGFSMKTLIICLIASFALSLIGGTALSVWASSATESAFYKCSLALAFRLIMGVIIVVISIWLVELSRSKTPPDKE